MDIRKKLPIHRVVPAFEVVWTSTVAPGVVEYEYKKEVMIRFEDLERKKER